MKEWINEWIHLELATFSVTVMKMFRKVSCREKKRQRATASYIGLEELEQVYSNDVCLPICSWKNIFKYFRISLKPYHLQMSWVRDHCECFNHYTCEFHVSD